ncbi:MAG: hypothetical protein ACK4QW_11970 [Alphaproteobacteria bacterium]
MKALLRATVVGIAATAMVQGAAAAERTLTFAHVLEQDHPYHHMAVKFAEEVAARAPELKVGSGAGLGAIGAIGRSTPATTRLCSPWHQVEEDPC